MEILVAIVAALLAFGVPLGFVGGAIAKFVMLIGGPKTSVAASSSG